MLIRAIDTETPKFDKKHPWKGNVYGDPRGIVCWSWTDTKGKGASDMWNGGSKDEVQALVDHKTSLLVFFNGKHDVGYLRKAGVDLSKTKVWDVQLGEFVLERQLVKFPSLNDTCKKYGLRQKLDVVKTEYWDKGIDTCDVPPDILLPYAALDPELTLECYYAQIKLMTPAQRVLVSLMSQDMLVLQEMEWNGIPYDEQLCNQRSEEIALEIDSIKADLSKIYNDIPINFGSNDHLSAFLYGGTIKEDVKVFDGFFKTGLKKGEPKYKNAVKEHILPQLFKPLDGSEVKKDGFYQTNEGVLKKLKGKNKPILEKLLRLSKLEKLNGTYYLGLPSLNEEMHWPPGMLHGQFNQTLATTGRLSSSKPNQQNFATEIQDIFVSRYIE